MKFELVLMTAYIIEYILISKTMNRTTIFSTMAYFQLLNDAIFVLYLKNMFLVVIKIHQSRKANKEGHSIKFMVPQLRIN